MKEAFLQMARYNAWANRRMTETMLKLDDSILDLEVQSSFPTLRKTLHHIYAAENVWMQRLQLVERPQWPTADELLPFAELCNKWIAASEAMTRFVEKQFNDKSFQHVVEYLDLKRNVHKTPVIGILQHLFNHSTFHRGQLVTMLRAAGQTKIPQTDLIVYLRSGGK